MKTIVLPSHVRLAALKAAVVLVPSYTAAYLTEKMVWVVPTLAAAGFFAATLGGTGDTATRSQALRRRVEEDEIDPVEYEYEPTSLETSVEIDPD